MEKIFLLRFIGHPTYDFLEPRFAGAFHTAEASVIADVDRFKPLE